MKSAMEQPTAVDFHPDYVSDWNVIYYNCEQNDYQRQLALLVQVVTSQNSNNLMHLK